MATSISIPAAVGLFLGLASACAAAPLNLVRNSDFTRRFASGGPADGWAATRVAEGGANTREATGGVDGGPCHHISAPASAEATWYIARQIVRGLKPGDTGLLSGQVRTRGAVGGSGAYLGFNYFDAGGVRLSWQDSPGRVTGDGGWTRLTMPFAVPPGTARVELNLVLHGHGDAWFDRMQATLGSSDTPWAPQEPVTTAAQGRGRPSLAILRDNLPASGTPSNPAALARMASAAGAAPAFLTAADLADPRRLNASRFAALAMPYGGAYPAAAADNIRAFLEQGGGLLSVGGYPFDRPLVRTAKGWVPVGDAEPDRASLRPFLAPAPGAGWSAGGRDIPEAPAPIRTDAGRACAAFGTPAMPSGGWVTLGSPELKGLPADAVAVAFEARSAQPDLHVAVEMLERDGARWRSTLTLTNRWRLYQVSLAELEYWKDNPSKGRGVAGDRPKAADITAIRFGITTEFVKAAQPYEALVGHVWTSAVQPVSWRHARLNSAEGGVNPATFLETDPGAVSICDAGAPLSDVAAIVPDPGASDLGAAWRLAGAARGWSAIGQTGQGAPGAPLKARWEPLARAVDRYGRRRGTAFGVMWNFAGSYPGSVWAYSGISDRNLLAPGAAGQALLKAALDRMTRGVFLFEAKGAPACARPGETVRVSAMVGNVAAWPRKAVVRLRATCGATLVASRSVAVTVPTHGAAPVRFDVAAPADAPAGLLRLAFIVTVPDGPGNALECGVALWSPRRQQDGAIIAYRDNVMDRGRGPEFLLGSQIYWGNGSVTGTDPLRWHTQLAAMADNGISVARSFMNVPGGETEAAWRSRDAMVQLAQEAGINLFYEGLSWPSADPGVVRERNSHGATMAERYRNAPGLFVDIRNEPTLAQQADTPDPLRTGTDALRKWAAETRASVRTVDPKRLVSVGYLQGFGNTTAVWDPIHASLDQDFTNRHYYGAFSQFAGELKQIDLRLLGKAPSTGEFGFTSHPGLKTHFVYESEASGKLRYGTVPHLCFGAGALFSASWHWQDPVEDIFPCGALLSDGAPRDRLHSYRNAGALFRTFQPRYVRPDVWLVLPTAERLSARRPGALAAMDRATEALLGLNVDFTTLPDDQIDQVQGAPKLAVWAGSDEPAGPAADLRARVLAAGGAWVQVRPKSEPDALRVELVRACASARFARHRLAPDAATVQSFRVQGLGGSVAHVLVNTLGIPFKVQIMDLPKPVEIWLAPGGCGYVAFDGEGRVTAAEGTTVAVAGEKLWAAERSLAAVALDGRDLSVSATVVLLPDEAGSAWLHGALAKATCSVGEIVNRAWKTYETVRPAAGRLRLDASMARAWILATQGPPTSEQGRAAAAALGIARSGGR